MRLDGLEEVTHHHNLAHKAERMKELEKELRALRLQNQSAERGRSPTPGRGGTGVDDRGRSPGALVPLVIRMRSCRWFLEGGGMLVVRTPRGRYGKSCRELVMKTSLRTAGPLHTHHFSRDHPSLSAHSGYTAGETVVADEAYSGRKGTCKQECLARVRGLRRVDLEAEISGGAAEDSGPGGVRNLSNGLGIRPENMSPLR